MVLQLAQLIVNAGGVAAVVDYVGECKSNVRLPGIMMLGYVAAHSENLAMAVIVSKVATWFDSQRGFGLCFVLSVHIFCLHYTSTLTLTVHQLLKSAAYIWREKNQNRNKVGLRCGEVGLILWNQKSKICSKCT